MSNTFSPLEKVGHLSIISKRCEAGLDFCSKLKNIAEKLSSMSLINYYLVAFLVKRTLRMDMWNIINDILIGNESNDIDRPSEYSFSWKTKLQSVDNNVHLQANMFFMDFYNSLLRKFYDKFPELHAFSLEILEFLDEAVENHLFYVKKLAGMDDIIVIL